MKPTKPVYVDLFHGRDDPNQEMDDWGYEGPSLGPFSGIQTTYGCHIRPVIDGDSPGDFHFVEGCLMWRGKYYGDWVVAAEPAFEVEQIEQTKWHLFEIDQLYWKLRKMGEADRDALVAKQLGLVPDLTYLGLGKSKVDGDW